MPGASSVLSPACAQAGCRAGRRAVEAWVCPPSDSLWSLPPTPPTRSSFMAFCLACLQALMTAWLGPTCPIWCLLLSVCPRLLAYLLTQHQKPLRSQLCE